MNVPEPMYISSRLLAAYDFEDGSTLEIGSGEYVLTDAQGTELINGLDFLPGALCRDYLDMVSDVAAFMRHDGELYEFSPDGSWGKRYPDSATEVEPEEWVFGPELGKWAHEHDDELSDLAEERD